MCALNGDELSSGTGSTNINLTKVINFILKGDRRTDLFSGFPFTEQQIAMQLILI